MKYQKLFLIYIKSRPYTYVFSNLYSHIPFRLKALMRTEKIPFFPKYFLDEYSILNSNTRNCTWMLFYFNTILFNDIYFIIMLLQYYLASTYIQKTSLVGLTAYLQPTVFLNSE